jgi:hypothetical protein
VNAVKISNRQSTGFGDAWMIKTSKSMHDWVVIENKIFKVSQKQGILSQVRYSELLHRYLSIIGGLY